LRALGSSVLAFEIIVSILFVPAAIQESSISNSNILVIAFVQILLAILAMGTLGKSYGIYLGYLTQIALIGSGFVVSWMFVLGLIFLGLWILALRIGRRTDEIKASKKAS
jgi:hypothetical protein